MKTDWNAMKTSGTKNLFSVEIGRQESHHEIPHKWLFCPKRLANRRLLSVQNSKETHYWRVFGDARHCHKLRCSVV